MEAKIDQNDVKTWLAYNETTGLVEPVRVDPVTGALKCFGVADTGLTYTTVIGAKIDANDVKIKTAYNNIIDNLESLRCGRGGELLITVPLA
jgi:hypothetical protein